MKFSSLIFLSMISLAASAGEKCSTKTMEQASNTTSADNHQVQQTSDPTKVEAKHQILKTQFLGKRPYMEKNTK